MFVRSCTGTYTHCLVLLNNKSWEFANFWQILIISCIAWAGIRLLKKHHQHIKWLSNCPPILPSRLQLLNNIIRSFIYNVNILRTQKKSLWISHVKKPQLNAEFISALLFWPCVYLCGIPIHDVTDWTGILFGNHLSL